MIARKRANLYWTVGIGLCLLYFIVQDSSWRSDAYIHTLMETAATLLALVVGVVALVRYYSNPGNHFLFIGMAFLGTGFLDAYHTAITSSWLKSMVVSMPASLTPWSWFASRLFLAVMLWLGLHMHRREERLGEAGRLPHRSVFTASAVFTLICFFFFALMPLPGAQFVGPHFLHRPQEHVPALFFALALFGYLRDGKWRSNDLEHWLVLSLIVNLVCQTVFMSDAHALFDPQFDMAHLLKKAAYLCVLTGLLINMLFLYQRADLVERLEEEIKERRQAQEAVRQLNKYLENRVSLRTAELEMRTHQLEIANRDLEGFSYSVSHDLRAPLRAIDGFIAIIEEDYGKQLDPEAMRLFGIVQGNARKMGELIDDILAFSRASRLEIQLDRVDMKQMVSEVWATLAEERAGRAIEFDCGELMPVAGDSRALRQVWQNLLGNAIKFSRTRNPACIHVESRRMQNGTIEYSVRDNGVGFNPDYTNKLFVLFQRLHSMEEFEGTGVGLCLVKRFIQKHHGEVVAEGAVDAGATFRFSLPDVPLPEHPAIKENTS